MDRYIEAVVAIEDSESLPAIQAAVRSAGVPLGYDRFVMFSASPARDDLVDKIYWVEGDWFGKGVTIDAETYVRHCPVTRNFLNVDQSFFWTKVMSARGEKYRVVRTPRGPGFHGLQVPVFGRTGLEGAMSLAGTRIEASAQTRVVLTMVGVAAFRAARRLMQAHAPNGPSSLSPREREVLRWTAAGRRQADIAASLGLSMRTVENHLRRARFRLGVATTAQAIRLAIRSGEIED
ncbi:MULTISPECIES: PA1136 family autoinducer-binding transcriptional regulator [Bradyrhizobium]|jgi:LuxR family transcriptional regulator (chaperone HchA-associated)|uniref:PA1136 family autoinducer-binding transcriptional regulator n=1 Tax=Bradyrhizobium TaxID=374 RepID=UPI00040B97D8|nr:MULTISPECIES: PA1136 family autoinducer-binding transcriptional regulator [Bradyrhizobium]KIU45868.1 LuxR family transcriptional regulator [Bradyrhizobium elkanii]MBK5650469.1 autoinducer binding domain-containing protein [Rhizobium sp.]OCX27101.1 LuxR family transcriptional regulator [Bradyrhizobium sp. UASWS1016]